MKTSFTRIILSFLLAAIFASCGASKPAETDSFIAAEWNMQALFDGEENGSEYGEYRESSNWTKEKYTARLTAISQAILKMTGEDSSTKSGAPDLIGLVEIENAGVLEDLTAGGLSNQGYCWTAFATLPGSPLGIGFISRYPILEARAHSITVGKNTAPRPVLEARIELREEALVFLLCHWKSKLGGDKATEALRRASARVVQRRLRELAESEAETSVIVMGDLNENHDEFCRRSYLCALLPDDPDAAALAHKAADYLVLSREKPPRASSFPEGTPALYSPWDDELTGGSYLFRDQWETIDHILLSEKLFDSSGWEFYGCRVLNHPPFVTAAGIPDSYNPVSGRGLSDHLPLLLKLRFMNP